MAQSFVPLSLVAIRLRYLLLRGTTSTGPSIYLLVIYTTASGERIVMALYSLASSLSRNVSVVLYYI
jgi:hypothetical protein